MELENTDGELGHMLALICAAADAKGRLVHSRISGFLWLLNCDLYVLVHVFKTTGEFKAEF